jgi:hypothetical protein
MPAGESRFHRFLPAAGVAALAVALLISFGIDAWNAGQGGAIDLRNRITGARLLTDGVDPYTYKWQHGESEIYCDPFNNPHMTVSKTTSSPALLALSLPWAALPYRSTQYLWFITQWALLLGTGWLWWRACRERWQRVVLGVIFAAFTFGGGWRLHAERGQSYILLTFLLALWLAGTLRAGKRWAFAAGVAAGLLAVSRPPCLLLLPALAWKRRDQLWGMGTGLVLGAVVPMLFIPAIWSDYDYGMQQHAYYYLNALFPRPGPQTFPSMVEFLPTTVLAYYVPIAYSDASIHVLLRALGWEPAPGLAVFLAAAIPFAAWAGWAVRRGDFPRLLLGLAAWMYLLDFFLPAYRNTYNDVLALGFLGLGVLVTPRFWLPHVATAIGLVTGLWVYVTSPEVVWQIDLPAMCFALSAVLYLFAPRGTGPMLDTTAAPRQNDSC